MGIVIVLLVTVLMSAIGAALALATAAEVVIAGHFQRAHEARHAAAGAIEVALGEFRALPDWNGILDGSVRSAHAEGPPTGVRTVAGQPIDLGQLRSLLECQQLAPCTNAAVATVTAERPWGADNPRWRLFRYGPWTAVAHAPSAHYVVVLVADDPAEQDGDPGRDGPAGAPGAGRVRARAEAFGPGGAHAAVEALLERNSFTRGKFACLHGVSPPPARPVIIDPPARVIYDRSRTDTPTGTYAQGDDGNVGGSNPARGCVRCLGPVSG